MARRNWKKVFVTGGTSFVGLRTVAALVEAGAEVTVLVTPETEERLGMLRRHVRTVYGDVWNSASLKGRSRGHGVVLHLVGSIRAEPARGLTFHQINLVSARNAIGMAVSDGVPYFVLLSAASKPVGVPSEYIFSKREAEEYLQGSGLRWAIVRAPVLFERRQRGGSFFASLSWISGLLPLRMLLGRRAALPVDIAARGLAQIALQGELPRDRRYYAGDLRRLGRLPREGSLFRNPLRAARREEIVFTDTEEVPFGWLPGAEPRGDE